jgi:hypothetical protein
MAAMTDAGDSGVPAGWFADPGDPGTLRWWDGTQWTEHRHQPEARPDRPSPVATDPAGGGGDLVRVPAGPGARKEIAAGPDWFSYDGEVFAFAEIDTVQWTAVRSHLNGAYMGLHYRLRVRAGDRTGDSMMDTGSKNTRIDEFTEAYSRIVGLLDAFVCPRLAGDMATAIRAGETITLGPAGARVELTAAGFRLKKPLAKVVPWEKVVGTEAEGGRLWFRLDRADEEPKRHAMVGLEGDNIVVLPHLVHLLATPR